MNSFEELKQFYKGKRVLVTGNTGFKGTWMTVMLNELQAEVCGYSLPLNPYSFYCQTSVKAKLQVENDITDVDRVLETADAFQPEIMIHLASHSSLYGSESIPDYILKTNLMGTLNVLEAARRNPYIKAVVIVTSDKCYENRETDIPYQETEPLGGKDPYSTSKVCQELLTACYNYSFFEISQTGCAIATARASNVIGPGDYNIDRLMPYLLDSFANGRKAKIRNPFAVRPWQNVLEVVYGYLLLAKKLYESFGVTKEYNGAYNFGPSDDGFATVGEVVELLKKQFVNAEYLIEAGNVPVRTETQILKLDSTKAKNKLDWEVKYSLDDTIRFTTEFVKQEKEGKKLSDLCRYYVQHYLLNI